MSAVTAAATNQEVASLALLGLKCKPNLFDLSSSLAHVSIRDQIIRGQLLARDLRAADPDFRSLLVIGAGVAGLAAAAEAADANLEVNVIDIAAQPLARQRGVISRFVGPFMYEWPGPPYDDQTFPPTPGLLWPTSRPSTPSWKPSKPMPADDFANEYEKWLRGYLTSHLNFRVWTDVDPNEVRSYVHDFVKNAQAKCAPYIRRVKPPQSIELKLLQATPWPDPSSASWSSVWPDYVILAAGMGDEDLRLCDASLIEGLPFWENDKLKDASVPIEQIGVFGGGDGALQDVLRILTDYDHPLQLLDALPNPSRIKRLLRLHERELSSAEGHNRLYGTWSHDGAAYRQVDQVCARVASDMAKDPHVCNEIGKALRRCQRGDQPGDLHHFVRGSNFSKAYLLNRFLVHLLNECYKQAGKSPAWANCMRYHLHWDVEATSGTASGSRIQVAVKQTTTPVTVKSSYLFDQVVVRYGIEKNSIPAKQMIRLSTNESKQRTTLAQIHLPHMLYE